MFSETLCTVPLTAVSVDEPVGELTLLREEKGTYCVLRTMTHGRPVDAPHVITVIDKLRSPARALMHFDAAVDERREKGYGTAPIQWVNRPSDVFTFTASHGLGNEAAVLLPHQDHASVATIITGLNSPNVSAIHADADSPEFACLVAVAHDVDSSLWCKGESVPWGDVINMMDSSSGDTRRLYQLFGLLAANVPNPLTVHSYAAAITGAFGHRALAL